MIKVTGQIKQLQELQVFNAGLQNEFKKQILVLETFETNTPLRIEFTNGNIDKLKDLSINDNCLVEFVLTGNYDKTDSSKVYNSLIAKNLTKF